MKTFLRSDLPVASDASGRFLPWLVAVMIFVAALALAGAFALNTMVSGWTGAVTGTLTVQIPPAEHTQETEMRLDRAVRLLRSDPSITRAEPLAVEETHRLLEPWLGAPELLEDLPIPRLIDVDVHPERLSAINLDELHRRLRDVAPGATIDDHRVWMARLIDLAEALRLLAWGVLGLVTLSTMATVVHATRTALAVHHRQIEVLHLIGATDGYIARQFARRALWHGLLGGVIGLALSAPVFHAAGTLLDSLEGSLVPTVALHPGQWAMIAVLPLGAGLLAMVTARRTVRRTLVRMM